MLNVAQFLRGKPSPQMHAAMCNALNALNAADDPGRGRMRGRRLDAGETMLLSRMVEHVQAEVVKAEYAELKARKIIPLASGIPEGAETFTYRIRTQAGRARWISNGADDLPAVSAYYTEASSKIRTVGIDFRYTVTELLSASMSGISLNADLALDAREAVERFIDYVAALGDSSVGVYGFLKGEDAWGVDLDTVADGYTGTWGGAATGATMLADLQKFGQSVWLKSGGVYTAKRLILDDASYSDAATKPYSATIPDTVLEVFLRSSPSVREVIPWSMCNTADAQNNGARWVAQDPRPDAQKLIAPVAYRALPPQARGLYLEVPGYARFGGVVIEKPMTMVYLDGMRD